MLIQDSLALLLQLLPLLDYSDAAVQDQAFQVLDSNIGAGAGALLLQLQAHPTPEI